jgi:hypothetical protein
MNVSLMDVALEYDDLDDETDEYMEAVPIKSTGPGVWRYYATRMVFVLAVIYVFIRTYNMFVPPLHEAIAQQRDILESNTVNYMNKCIDLKVKLAYRGHDGCAAHERIMNAGLYYPAFQSYMRKMDLCGEKGCLSIEMHALSWFAFMLPVCLALGGMIALVMLVLFVINVQRQLSSRYEMPTRAAPTQWTRRQVVRRRVALEGPPACPIKS